MLLVIVEEKRVVSRKDNGCELKIQDVNIADSGSCLMVMWGQDVDTLEEGKCYEIDGAVVKKYGDVEYLAFGRDTVKRIVEGRHW